MKSKKEDGGGPGKKTFVAGVKKDTSEGRLVSRRRSGLMPLLPSPRGCHA